ncbi:MAG: hypothetical protein OK452_02330 [Thaumarchaeota archaeon]|nr:hypothetical protein [Nitrososphaerota archaeon]
MIGKKSIALVVLALAVAALATGLYANTVSPGRVQAPSVRIQSVEINKLGNLSSLLRVVAAPTVLQIPGNQRFNLNLTLVFQRTADDGEFYTSVLAITANLSVATPGFSLLSARHVGSSIISNQVFIPADTSVSLVLVIIPPPGPYDGPLKLVVSSSPSS